MARSIPVLRTWAAGEYVTGAYANANIRDLGNWMLQRPAAALRSTTGVTMTTPGTWYPVPFDTEDLDSDGAHSTVSATSRFVAPVAGWYWVSAAAVSAQAASAARFALGLTVNGSFLPSAYAGVTIPTAPTTLYTATVSKLVYLNATDYLEAQVSHTVASATLSTASSAQAFMHVLWASK